jgi:hypothetical protein
MLNIDFEEYETGTTLSMGQTTATNGYTTITTAYYMGDEDIIGVRGYNSFDTGDNKAFAIKEDEDGNKYAQMKPSTSASSRWGILNGFAHRDLTADDKGKTYLLTFRIRLAEGSPSGKIIYGMRTWLSSGSAYSGSKSLTVTNNEWQECAVTYTIAEADLSRKIMFTIEFVGTGGPVFEIDDVRVVRHSGGELGSGAFVASAENICSFTARKTASVVPLRKNLLPLIDNSDTACTCIRFLPDNIPQQCCFTAPGSADDQCRTIQFIRRIPDSRKISGNPNTQRS